MRLFSRLSAAVIAVTMLASTSVMADQLQDILDRGTIRIGVIQDVAPFGFLDDKQQPAGLDIDVSNLIAKDLGVKVELVPMTAPNRLPNLVTGKVDILVALLSLTPDRAKQIMFTSPYASTELGVYGPPDIAVTSPDQLGKHSIGVTRGTTEDAALTKLAPNANIIRFEDNATATTAYQTGQVELYATADIVAYALNKSSGARKLDRKFSMGADLAYMGVKQGEFGTLRWLDEFIHLHMLQGDLSKITEKWLAHPLPTLPTI
ncbi:MAG: transporter substrate-binding domain-containing protein [Devosia sp.]